MAQIQFMDNLLKEYLLFRGFSNTLKTLDNEQKTERDQSFRAEKIIEQFNLSIQAHDLQSLRSLWTHLDNYLFSKLEHSYASAVKKLENGLLKLYLVNARCFNRSDKITEFFSKLSSELQQQNEWKEWFVFPFCKNPEESPNFALYFSKQWQDTLQISLRNFLTTVYQCLPQPTFVRAEQEANYIRRLQEENALLKGKLQQISQQQIAGSGNSGVQSGSSVDGSGARRRPNYRQQQSLSDILPFDISPPGHVVDDFCIIASEANTIAQASEAQSRSLKMRIKNIGSGNSPTMTRKDTHERSASKGRSATTNWL